MPGPPLLLDTSADGDSCALSIVAVRHPEVIPAILATSRSQLLQALLPFPAGTRIHLDVVGSPFADRRTLTPRALATLPRRWRYELHLMDDHPGDFNSCRPHCEEVIVHAVGVRDWSALCRAFAPKPLALALEVGEATPAVSALAPRPCGLLVVDVRPGAQGQPATRGTARYVRSLPRGAWWLGVDGSVSQPRLAPLIAAGATHLVVGSRIVSAAHPRIVLTAFQARARTISGNLVH